MRKLRTTIALGGVLALAVGTTAVAGGPDDEGVISPLDAHDHQHGTAEGHLPPKRTNVNLVGKLDLFKNAERPGHISDVGVYGNYAYLGAFYEPDCEEGGVYVVDISNPKKPTEAGFIPTSPFSYVGEGVQVLNMDTEAFKGQVLLFNNENCYPVVGAGVWGLGGASLWDVTDPEAPKPLAEHVGDTDVSEAPQSMPHSSHSVFGWQQGDRAYMAMVDNNELGLTDIDILDITDPSNPELIHETGMADFPEIAESPPANGAFYYNHDMVVKKVGEQWLFLSNYWDGGYVILDVTGLPEEKPKFLRDTDFGADPFADEMGLPADWIAEGNAHQGEFNRTGRFFLGADEDFDAFRNAGEILSGKYDGDSYSGTLGNNVPPLPEGGIQGGTQYVGQACGPVPPSTPDTPIAFAERGVCTFTVKALAIQAAGYDAALIFNDKATDPDCESQVFMNVAATIPALFVARSTALKLLNQDFTDPCQTDADASKIGGAPEEKTSLERVFDGWGYLHLFNARTMKDLDQWALPKSLKEKHAEGSGVLSIHEVAIDPRRNLAYVSHYAGGFRVIKFDGRGLRQVGAFIDKGGNDIWGVQVLDRGAKRKPLVLASDRDAGLYIFKYTG